MSKPWTIEQEKEHYMMTRLPALLHRGNMTQELFELGRDENYISQLIKYHRSHPENVLNFGNLLRKAAIEKGEVALIGEFLMVSSEIYQGLNRTSPLDLLKEGNLSAAIETARSNGPHDNVIWVSCPSSTIERDFFFLFAS